MLHDCKGRNLSINDRVLFIRRKFGTCLVEGYVRQLTKHSVVITETMHNPLGECLQYRIMYPAQDVYII